MWKEKFLEMEETCADWKMRCTREEEELEELRDWKANDAIMDELMKTKLEKETARCITLEETILVLEKRISKLVHWEAECIKF